MTQAHEETIGITSGVNREGKGFITIEWGEKKAQLTPNEARAHALAILECAEAAEAASAFMALCEKNGIIGGAMAWMMREFRILRWRREQSDPVQVQGVTGPLCDICGQPIFPGVTAAEGEHGPVHKTCFEQKKFQEVVGGTKH